MAGRRYSRGVVEPTLQVDLAELWMMYENESDFELELRDWLAVNKQPIPGGMGQFERPGCLDDPEVRKYGIRGFPWGSTLDWT